MTSGILFFFFSPWTKLNAARKNVTLKSWLPINGIKILYEKSKLYKYIMFNTAILEILQQLWEDYMVENKGLGETTFYRTT